MLVNAVIYISLFSGRAAAKWRAGRRRGEGGGGIHARMRHAKRRPYNGPNSTIIVRWYHQKQYVFQSFSEKSLRRVFFVEKVKGRRMRRTAGAAVHRFGKEALSFIEMPVLSVFCV